MTSILLASIVASVLTAVLAGLLLVAERYLVDYGPCRINVNGGKRTLDVIGGRTLLLTLRDEGIFIPSACGGRGTCAYCKCGIVAGGGPVGPTEAPLLTEQEAASDVRISCQVKVRNDLQVAIPEDLLLVQQFRGVVRRIRDLTHDIKELSIELIEPETIDFVPGQYVQLEAPPHGPSREPVFRAYSISSPPAETRTIEMIIRLVPGGICTTWVFERLGEGDEVSFTGPYGDFRLSDADGEMVWIAGGSGMAPFWSLIRHMKAGGAARPCTYFFGAVRQRDLFYTDELKTLAEELPWFRYMPALSGEPDDGAWTGARGLITEVVDRHVPPNARSEAYLCGSPGMIDAAMKVLARKGLTEDRIFFDKFE